jgi:hypothetical protein
VAEIDLESHFRTKIDNMLVTASWIDQAKDSLGLDGVSQIWTEKPAWYLWVAGAGGVFHLQLEAGFQEGKGGSEPASALFSIRCYPFRDGPFMDKFSVEEQGYVQSDLFDDTNTPQYAELGQLPYELFHVGSVELVLPEEEDWAFLELKSQDVMYIRSQTESEIEIPGLGRSEPIHEGSVLRRVPGWELSFQLFDKLVLLSSMYLKSTPLRVAMTKARGIEAVINEDLALRAQESPDAEALSLSIMMGKDPEMDEPAIDLERFSQEIGIGEQTIFDWHFTCRCVDHSEFPVHNSPYVNPMWWKIADLDRQSSLASVCGCH